MNAIIHKGANYLVSKTLKFSDGSQLLVSALSSATVELIQSDSVVETATYGTDAWLAKGASDELIYTLRRSVTATLATKTPIVLRWTFTIADSDFSADSSVREAIITETIGFAE